MTFSCSAFNSLCGAANAVVVVAIGAAISGAAEATEVAGTGAAALAKIPVTACWRAVAMACTKSADIAQTKVPDTVRIKKVATIGENKK